MKNIALAWLLIERLSKSNLRDLSTITGLLVSEKHPNKEPRLKLVAENSSLQTAFALLTINRFNKRKFVSTNKFQIFPRIGNSLL